MDNQLAYIDQGSFLAMRALGHEPVQQLVWVYDHDVDVERLREVHRNLGHTLLGRRIERSPLPVGRHRWVAAPDQSDLIVSSARPRAELTSWMDETATMGVDPERGPAWRMAVVPFTDGGGAVTVVVSHSVADVGGILFSIFAALAGVKADLGYPPPGSRTRRDARRADFRAFRSVLPEIATALRAAVPVLREGRPKASRPASPARPHDTTTAIRPSVFAFVPDERWDARAKEIGGNSGSLVAGFAVRLGALMGQARPDGRVTLNFPVSDRGDGDTRANALTAMTVSADPDEVLTDLAKLRADMKTGLKEVAAEPNAALAALPLVLLTPKSVARKLEWLALGDGPVVGCTNMGEVPEMLTQLDGTAAEFVFARGVEWPIGPSGLDRIGNWLLVGSCRLKGKVLLMVTAWQVGQSNTREQLADLIGRAAADFGLSATFI